MHPLQVQARAAGRPGLAEAAEQLVVAAPAAEGERDRGVVDFEDRAGVVAELVEEAVADLDPERELATARELAARRLAASRGLEPVVRFRRAAALH